MTTAEARSTGLTGPDAVAAINAGKFLAIKPETGEIRVTTDDQFVLHKLPRWFTKMLRVEGREYETLLDHPGSLVGTQTYIAQPYTISLQEIEDIAVLCRRYKLGFGLGGHSSWYPGATVHVALTPTPETFAILKLKQP